MITKLLKDQKSVPQCPVCNGKLIEELGIEGLRLWLEVAEYQVRLIKEKIDSLEQPALFEEASQ